MRACPRCRTPYPLDVAYCPADGAPLDPAVKGDDASAAEALAGEEKTDRAAPRLPLPLADTGARSEQRRVFLRPAAVAATHPATPTSPISATVPATPAAPLSPTVRVSPAGAFTVPATPDAQQSAAPNASSRGPTVAATPPRVKPASPKYVSPVAGTVRAPSEPDIPAAEPSDTIPDEALTANIGLELGNYRITEPLGIGGMGAVYVAEHKTIGKKAAAKLMHPNLQLAEEAIARFQQEAMAAAAIGHDNIVEVFDFGRTAEGNIFILMEYLDGKSLATILEESKKLSALQIAPLLRQICEGLAAAHERGIVHRDLKPDNIFLARRAGKADVIKLLDFGIAKLTTLDSNVHKPLTQTGMLVGTPQYMSPEQAEGREVDHRSDVYSLGIILYELLTGEIPFQADTLGQLMLAHVSAPPPPMSTVNLDAHVGTAVERVVQKALVKNPDGRWQSAKELSDAFRKAVRADLGEEEGAPLPLLETSLDKPRVDPPDRGAGDGRSTKPRPGGDPPVDERSRPTARAKVRRATTLATATPATKGLLIGLVAGSLLLSAAAVGTFIYIGATGSTATGNDADDERTKARDKPGRARDDDPRESTEGTKRDGTERAVTSTSAAAAASSTHLELRSTPSGAEVFLRRTDRRETSLGATPLERDLPGEAGTDVTIILRKKGYKDETMPVLLAPGHRVELDRTLRPATKVAGTRPSRSTAAGSISPPARVSPAPARSSHTPERSARSSEPAARIRIYRDDPPVTTAPRAAKPRTSKPVPRTSKPKKKTLKAGGLTDPFGD